MLVAKEGFGKHVYDLNDGDLAIIFKNCKDSLPVGECG
jgi:hypothetical protein